ncbi:MAG: HAMP domain-containing sensor histidine kinase [Myxococcota bacterium]
MPPTDDELATREAQLRHALPPLACLSGLIAATAAATQYWLGTGHFRPLAFALHLGLAALGAAWFRRPPVHASRAAFLVGVYLSTLIGTFILKSGELSSFANLALVSLGAAFMIADRRYLIATQLVVIAWFLIAMSSPLKVPSRLQLALCGCMVVATAGAVHLSRRRAVRRTAGRAEGPRRADPQLAAPAAAAARVGGSSSVASPALSREVVHDVNNLLGGILGGAELALASEQHPEDLQLALRQIRERVLATRDYMRGASRSGGKLEAVDVNGVIERAVGLARGLAGSGIKLVTDLEPELPPVEADRMELERAILNLLSNAIDASGEGSGEVRVRSRRLEEDAAPVVLVRVEDDGQGVAEADRARIFAPGFTTRGGDHQGLGLPFVAQVARRSGGEVRLDPRVASGAAFEVRIPARGPAPGGALRDR